jgi:surface antigen
MKFLTEHKIYILLCLVVLAIVLSYKKSMAMSENKNKTTIGIGALSMAVSQLGVTEIGDNGGAKVNEYQTATGNKSGDSWCMSFVQWCVNKAAALEGGKNPLFRSGLVMQVWNNSKSMRVNNPLPGDIFVMDRGNGKGHTGFVKAVNGDSIETIEGNSSPIGRASNQVCSRKGGRKLNTIKGFLRV